MASDDSNSGGSSPFLESPDVLPDVNDGFLPRTHSSVSTSKSNVSGEKDRQLISLEYKFSTLQNEYELERLQTQRQLNELDKKYRKTIEELETALSDTKYLHDTNNILQQELDTLHKETNQSGNDKDNLLSSLNLELNEKDKQLEDMQLNYDSKISKLENELQNLQGEKNIADNLVTKYNEDILRQSNEIRKMAKDINEKDDEILELKNSQIVNSHPNYNTEEFQELSTMNKLFQEQVKYSKELEEINFKQADEIKKYRNQADSSNFWKSENEKLQAKLQDVETLEKSYEDSQLEVIELKARLTSFNIFSENLESSDSPNIKPEQIINDLELTKKENLILVDENSRLSLNLSNIRILNEELALERTQLLDLNKNYESNIINMKKLNYELEQQKILSFEECKLLRKQLEELDEITNNSLMKNNEDESDTKDRLETNDKQFENLMVDYKNRTDDLTNELKKLNDQILTTQQNEIQDSKKRKINDSNGLNYYAQRMNEMQLENSRLNRDLQKFQNLNKLLETKIMKLINLKEKKIRILELRENPLARDQFVKRKQLELLQKENQDLLDQLNANEDIKTVPISVYEALNFDIKQQEQEIFKENKKFIRLKEVFNKKSLEFIDVVNSILGFKLEFKQDGKVKIYSCYKPTKYLVVDLKKNTLESNLNIENWDHLLNVWIEERGQIPCFLATITLQLWEASQLDH